MSDARTKLDILYQEVLGDVKEVLDRMDQLKIELPNVFDGAIALIQIEHKNISLSANKLNAGSQDIVSKIEAYVQASAKSAADAAKLDIRQATADSVNVLIKGSLQPILLQANIDARSNLDELRMISENILAASESATNNAINSLNSAINKLKKDVEKEMEKIEANKWNHMLHSGIGALFGTGFAILISTMAYLLLR
jgi:ribosome-associated translation inhibitor RaiA